MTAIDKAWDVAKQMSYNDALKQMVDSYVHGIELTMDSLDEFVMTSHLDSTEDLYGYGDETRSMFEDKDNPTMADTAFIKELMEVAKSEVLRRLRGA